MEFFKNVTSRKVGLSDKKPSCAIHQRLAFDDTPTRDDSSHPDKNLPEEIIYAGVLSNPIESEFTMN